MSEFAQYLRIEKDQRFDVVHFIQDYSDMVFSIFHKYVSQFVDLQEFYDHIATHIIDSIICKIPIRNIKIFQKEHYDKSTAEFLDGYGRKVISALYSYMSNDFSLRSPFFFSEYSSLEFKQLPAHIQRRIKDTTITIDKYSCTSKDEDVVRQVRNRIQDLSFRNLI